MNAKSTIKSLALATVMIIGGLMATGNQQAAAGGPGRGPAPGVHHSGFRGYGPVYRAPGYRPGWHYSGGYQPYRPYSYVRPYRPFPRPNPYPYVSPFAYPGVVFTNVWGF